MTTFHKFALVAAIASASAFGSCSSVDESSPTHPRTAELITPSQTEKDSADKRVLETPSRQIPTGTGPEFPGQSKAAVVNPVILASDISTPPTQAPRAYHPIFNPRNYGAPSVEYNTDNYSGSVPHLAEKPGTIPSVGAEVVPNTPWMIDNGWGEVLPLQSYPHRAWQETNTNYYSADVKHNPTYYFHIESHIPVPQADGTVGGDLAYSAYEIPWFAVNTAILPVLMVLDPPLSQHTTGSPSLDPIYNGYLPTQGEIVPSPTPGIIRWEYSFLKRTDADSQPSPTTIEAPTTVAPGLDKAPIPADTIPATPTPPGQ